MKKDQSEKRFWILEKNTGLCDGTYPNDFAYKMLDETRKNYPMGDFCLVDAENIFITEQNADKKLFSGMGEKFINLINECRNKKN